jgi:hypothetical protein
MCGRRRSVEHKNTDKWQQQQIAQYVVKRRCLIALDGRGRITICKLEAKRDFEAKRGLGAKRAADCSKNVIALTGLLPDDPTWEMGNARGGVSCVQSRGAFCWPVGLE